MNMSDRIGKTLKVFYQDHHGLHTDPEEAISSSCLNWVLGEVVAEDQEWIRVCHGQADVGGEFEEWEVDSVRVADIVKVEER
jgi:hypothetical protein